MNNLKSEIINLSKSLNFDKVGFCKLEYFKDLEKILIKKENLKYKTNFEVGKIDDKVFKNSKYKSAIVFLLSYNKFDLEIEKNEVHLSSCAIGTDYHIIIKEKLEKIKEYLNNLGYDALTNVDNNIYDERYLAYKCGLGFYGKNHLLINPELGSLFFIGTILTNAIFEYDKVSSDKCIGCDKCVNACPTGALDYKYFNGNKCLSYLTQKKILTTEESKYINSCVYGCDICINICPYNSGKKSNNFKYTGIEKFDMNNFLMMSEDEYKEKYKDNASFWRGKKIIDRNINIYKENNLKK